MKTLVELFHPNLQASIVNRRLAEAANVKENVTIRNLYELYPDFKIDVEEEQRHLLAADRIVLQFPMYWYSSPALVKQWEDAVLEYGWAYGTNGDQLKNKELLIAVTPGAPAENYVHDGPFKYTVHDLLRPFQATSNLIGTRFVKPFVVTGASSIQADILEQQAAAYAEYLSREQLELLGDYE
ncbi:NAD(P)H-dependent oxidoreductase [Enterococcus sp. LJL90]